MTPGTGWIRVGDNIPGTETTPGRTVVDAPWIYVHDGEFVAQLVDLGGRFVVVAFVGDRLVAVTPKAGMSAEDARRAFERDLARGALEVAPAEVI